VVIIRKGGDGWDLFSPPYKPPVKVRIDAQYEASECVQLIDRLISEHDMQTLRNVLSVAMMRLDDCDTLAVADDVARKLTMMISTN
jgi:hypothetical protein